MPIAPVTTPAPVLPSTNGPISLASGSLASGNGSKAVKAEPKPPVLAEPPAPRPEVKPAPPPQQAALAVGTTTGKSTPKGGSGEFIWPIAGQVLKGFGPAANGQRNDGVNISAPKGADIVAAAGGEVVYAGSELAGFGNLVLIRHPGGWVTAYAHADSILVTEGDLVRQGQVVAKAGSTGNAGSPQVHFELRKGKEPVDPTLHLPALRG
jgi:murein DD-endopeptidase MepM/ murein hydrolase activator NlpD